MDFVDEAKKFIQRATEADHPDVVKENLKMADWCLGQAIEERSGDSLAAAPNGQTIRPS